MMNVWIAASEAVPFAKTGGLADVTGALSVWLSPSSVRATLIMPLYRGIRDWWDLGAPVFEFEVPLGSDRVRTRIFRLEGNDREVLFVDHGGFFDREGLYGTPGGVDHFDNAARFAFFSKAVLEAAERSSPRPDVVHCHDWQTGLVPFFLASLYRSRLPSLASLFTIHNLGYQGVFASDTYRLLGVGPEYFHPGAVEYWGDVCFLKAGIVFADGLNTVSPTYAREILTPEFGFGLDGVLRDREADFRGILNGIDVSLWNPATDSALAARYSADDRAGRVRCREALRCDIGFDPRGNRPLFGFVGRLAFQKGVDLIADCTEDLLRAGIDLVVLGDGDATVKSSLRLLADQYPHRISVTTDFDEKLARKIYAGSDGFLMPSRYEPCGLGQLIALRYGALPVVSKTGGLADTVREVGDGANGFVFSGLSTDNLLASVTRAVHLRRHRGEWDRRVANGMREDHSWAKTVGEYVNLYRETVGKGIQPR